MARGHDETQNGVVGPECRMPTTRMKHPCLPPMKVPDVAHHMQQVAGMSFIVGAIAQEDGQTRVEQTDR
jgi:hypothetical protein